MKPNQLQLLFDTFDSVRHQNGQEYWFARELYERLGYSSWDTFKPTLERAKDSVKTQKIPVENHFQDVTKMVEIGSGASRETKDIRLTRYAAYMIALNGDPRKPEI
ncbi:MAG: DNA damage-inducible protein D, partial [Patescibacteria group bacterium]|nr:DNA damage-inducible protein D [Patescibacteria group bacterium]